MLIRTSCLFSPCLLSCVVTVKIPLFGWHWLTFKTVQQIVCPITYLKDLEEAELLVCERKIGICLWLSGYCQTFLSNSLFNALMWHSVHPVSHFLWICNILVFYSLSRWVDIPPTPFPVCLVCACHSFSAHYFMMNTSAPSKSMAVSHLKIFQHHVFLSREQKVSLPSPWAWP